VATPTDLSQFIRDVRICDTHEHMFKEAEYRKQKPDILCEIFDNYVLADFGVAGATEAQVQALRNPENPDIEARFAPVAEIWKACRFTGYGEAAREIAKRFFGIEEFSVRALRDAQAKLPAAWPAGERLRLLRDEARLDHIQVDDFCWPCLPDESGPDFFFYDIRWADFCYGELKTEELFKETGVQVRDLETLREGMAKIFTKYADMAIAVKSQHAYTRSIAWQERSDAEAAPVLQRALAGAKDISQDERILLGDWCTARGVELAIQHNLPFKIHTGYLAGHSYMQPQRISAAHLSPLLARYREARFVLMHISYPYENEIVALAKHYRNVYLDLCWAWSLNPFKTTEMVRNYIHAVPSNKLFVFGGDIARPRAAVAYAEQCRRGLERALSAEIESGFLTEKDALELARWYCQENQRACFDIEGRRARAKEKLAQSR